MEPLVATIFIAAGVLLLYLGAEFLISGGASLAIRFGLPTLVIGLTVIGYGSGAPEVLVSAIASLQGKGDIALGNVIGSNIANSGLILGLSALIRPLKIHKRILSHDGIVMMGVTLLVCGLYFFEAISRFIGFIFLIGFLLYTVWAIYDGKTRNHDSTDNLEAFELKQHASSMIDFFLISIGFILLFIGSKLFLDGAMAVALKFGISDAVIGLTLVAFGTSLPELATSLLAVYRKHGDIVVGNIIGSNIFNILAIVGIASMINPIIIEGISGFDFMVLALYAFGIFGMMAMGNRLSRFEGAILLCGYMAYIAVLIKN